MDHTIAEIVRACHTFERVSDAQMREIADAGCLRQFKRGAEIIGQETVSGEYFIMVEGQAEASIHNANGKKFVIDVYSKGNDFGINSCIPGGIELAAVFATTKVAAVAIPTHVIKRRLAGEGTIDGALLAASNLRVRQITQRLFMMAISPVSDRVKSVLAGAAQPMADGRFFIPGRIACEEIARKVGASNEMTRKVIQSFRAEFSIAEDALGRTIFPSGFF